MGNCSDVLFLSLYFIHWTWWHKYIAIIHEFCRHDWIINTMSEPYKRNYCNVNKSLGSVSLVLYGKVVIYPIYISISLLFYVIKVSKALQYTLNSILKMILNHENPHQYSMWRWEVSYIKTNGVILQMVSIWKLNLHIIVDSNTETISGYVDYILVTNSSCKPLSVC